MVLSCNPQMTSLTVGFIPRKNAFINRVLLFLIFAFTTTVFAQFPQLKSGSTVYIEPTGGYETYLAAALAKKQVPLIVVVDKKKADYIIAISQQSPTQPLVVLNQNPWAGSTSMSISVIDAKSSQIVYSYTVSMRGNDRTQSATESCAKHVKEFIEKSEKQKR